MAAYKSQFGVNASAYRPTGIYGTHEARAAFGVGLDRGHDGIRSYVDELVELIGSGKGRAPRAPGR